MRACSRALRTRLAGTVLAALATTAAPLAVTAGEPIAVVVHPGNAIDDVSSAALADLYMGKTSALGGSRRAPVTYADDAPIRMEFEKLVLHLEPSALAKHWKSRSFLGFGDAQPLSFGTALAVKRHVARQKGALGFLPLSQVDPSVHVVRKVDGHESAAPDYPFRMP